MTSRTDALGSPHAVATAALGTRAAGRERLVPLAIGLLAAVLYLWNLGVSGYANSYYSAAAQAGSQSWGAWFFGSLDAAGFITVDKPPLALWVMGLSVRVLGLGPVAILLPEALAGVASVLVLYAAVRRTFGTAAAAIAGVAFAITPVAALMFRYNNPDAVLTLLLVSAAWAQVRALDDDRLRWVALSAALVGLAFLTKYLQASLVLPALGITYLLAARGSPGRRLVRLLAAAVILVAASSWWVVIVELIPAASRPYIGGSSNNSVVDLILGYDGLGRIFAAGFGAAAGPGGSGAIGGGSGPGPFGGGGTGFGGQPGLLRMINADWVGEIGWLLPTAAAALVVGLSARLRAPRTDGRRAGFLLWGLWAAVHVLVFSLMTGIVHPYYAVALAPALAALVGGGVVELWRLRERFAWAGVAIGLMIVATAAWGRQILERTPAFHPGFGLGAVFLALAAAIVLAVPVAEGDARAGAIGRAAVVVGLAAALVGPSLYTVETMNRALTGGTPASGPPGGLFAAGVRAVFGAFGAFPGDPAGTNQALVDYLVANRGSARWLSPCRRPTRPGPSSSPPACP